MADEEAYSEKKTPPLRRAAHMKVNTPLELRVLHQFSSYHTLFMTEKTLCGCYYCLQAFRADEIREWADNGNTALCPRCNIDAVLPELMIAVGAGRLQHTIARSVLERMHGVWFEGAMTSEQCKEADERAQQIIDARANR